MRKVHFLLKILLVILLAVFAAAAVSTCGSNHTNNISVPAVEAPEAIPVSEPEETPAASPEPSPTSEPTPSPVPTPEPKPIPWVKEYEEGVETGFIRYVWQLQEAEKNGWGKYAWKAGAECTTACISMALSYLGVDASPEALLDFSSKTYLQSCYGMEDLIDVSPFASPSYEEGESIEAFRQMFRLYDADRAGKFSPVLVYFTGNGHYHALIVTGRFGDEYLTVDPTPKGIHRIRISDDGKITTAEEGYLTRYITDDSPAVIVSLSQWILK